jgi:GNAT superfamily N-acetyltransferase
MQLDIHPLTPQRWNDLVSLFERPGCSIARGCWCVFYRETGKAIVPKNLSLREARKRSFKKLVERGVVPGLLGYLDGQPVGWVSLGPREDYARLARSPIMKQVDDKPVWSIVCFVVDPKVRHQGAAAALLKGALAWARKNKVNLVEAYPVDKSTTSADDSMWFGAKSMYDHAGFVEVARRKPTRPVVRKALRNAPRARTA